MDIKKTRICLNAPATRSQSTETNLQNYALVKDYDNEKPLETDAAATLGATYRALAMQARYLCADGAKSITIPFISTGILRFPLEAQLKEGF